MTTTAENLEAINPAKERKDKSKRINHQIIKKDAKISRPFLIRSLEEAVLKIIIFSLRNNLCAF
jgi:hypothetical protein